MIRDGPIKLPDDNGIFYPFNGIRIAFSRIDYSNNGAEVKYMMVISGYTIVSIDLFILICADLCLACTFSDIGLRHPNHIHTSRRRFGRRGTI